MTKNQKSNYTNQKTLDEVDKLLFSLTSKNTETPKHIKDKIQKTIDEIFK